MKKGMSDVVFLGVMMLISLSVISLISLSLANFLRPSFSPEFSCLDYQVNPPLDITRACYNPETMFLEISLVRSLDSNSLDDFVISLSEKDYSCGKQCGSCNIPSPGETKILYLATEEIPSEATIKINDCVLKSYLIRNC